MRASPVIVLGVAAALVLGGCSGGEAPTTPASALPTTPCGTYSGSGCAPDSKRIDLTRPSFTDPTRITNPLFPISRLRSVVLLGHVEGKPFRTETTLLPGTQTVSWAGQRVRVLLSQYMAYLDGRLEEVALDRYAQADDGSVWYLGEDVYDYEDGTIALTEGTWLAGREGPAAMIMPAHPKVGDVYRTENAPGIVFEEVTVKSVGKKMVASELHSDGTHEDKVFVRGYGEYRTAAGGDLEALALAVPTDAARGAEPPQLRTLAGRAEGALESVRLEDWEAAASTVHGIERAWQTLHASRQPRAIVARLEEGLGRLERAVKAHDAGAAAQAAVDASQPILDLQLRYRPPVDVDVARFHLWTQQLRVHARAGDLAGVTGAVATLEWIRDRIPQALDRAARREVDGRLRDLRSAADTRNLRAAADHAARLGARVRTLAG